MGRPSKGGSGGARTGTPGVVYSPARSDLNTNRAPTAPAFKGQVYGTGVQQQAVAAAAAPVQPGIPQGQLVPNGVPAPGQFPHLLGPTERPNEPVTAGLPFGAGPNSIQQPFVPSPMAAAAALLSTIAVTDQSPGVRAILNASKASVANASNPGVIQ